MMLPAANDVVLRTNDVAPRGGANKGKNPPCGFLHLYFISPLISFGREFLREGADCPPQLLPQAGGDGLLLCTELSLYFVINLKFALANFYLNLSPVAKGFTAMPSTFKLMALPFAVAHSIFYFDLLHTIEAI